MSAITGDDDGPRTAASFSDSPASYVIAAILLGAAFVALLWVPSYAHLEPALGGIPFFYWYSILWLVLNMICQAIAYQLLRRRRSGPVGTSVPEAGRG